MIPDCLVLGLLVVVSSSVAQNTTSSNTSTVPTLPVHVTERLNCDSQERDCLELAGEYNTSKLFNKYCTLHYEDGSLVGFQTCSDICSGRVDANGKMSYGWQCSLKCSEFLSECRQLLTPKPPELEQQTTRVLTEQECCTASDDMCMSGCVSTCYDDKDYDNHNSDRKASCHKICIFGSSSGRLKCGQLCPGYFDKCPHLITTGANTVTQQGRQWTTEECCYASDDMCGQGCHKLCYSYLDFDGLYSNASCRKICTSEETDDFLQCKNECPAFNDTCFVTMGSSDAPRNATTDEVPYVNVHPPLLNIWVAVGIPVGAIGALVIGTIAVVVWKCRSQSTRNRTRHDRAEDPVDENETENLYTGETIV